jgi:hypothetical protein
VPQADLDAIRASFEHFNRTGYLLEDSFQPDVEIINLRESPIPGPYRGFEGLRRWSDDIREVLSVAWFEIDEMTDLPDASAVISSIRLRGRALHTDLEIDVPMWLVSSQRDGLTYRSEAFSDHAEALAAAHASD